MFPNNCLISDSNTLPLQVNMPADSSADPGRLLQVISRAGMSSFITELAPALQETKIPFYIFIPFLLFDLFPKIVFESVTGKLR